MVTFTCTQDPPDSVLRWSIIVQFSFPRDQPPAEQTLNEPDSEVNRTATIISYSPNTTVVSTLTITVTRQLDGYVVECAGTTQASIQSTVTVINIASMCLH